MVSFVGDFAWDSPSFSMYNISRTRNATGIGGVHTPSLGNSGGGVSPTFSTISLSIQTFVNIGTSPTQNVSEETKNYTHARAFTFGMLWS